jgi:hypothetical protein
MLIDRAWLVQGSAMLVVAALLWAGFELTPGRRLERAQDRLLQAAGDGNWDRVRDLLDADYRDAWGQNREEAVTLASEILGNFLVLEILSEDTTVERRGREASISARLRLRGRGNAVGEEIISRANSLDSHFQFAWRRKSWKPWGWKLVSLNQPQFDTLWMP